MNFDGIYDSKRVLITGHTGFKGSWLSLWLNFLGAKVEGIALNPEPHSRRLYDTVQPSISKDHRFDILEAEEVRQIVRVFQPDFVFHLAAQPLVIESYRDPIGTVKTNVIGTVNLLDAIRQEAPQAHAVIVTTDKVYENLDWAYPYREPDRLGGHDVYAASKAATEILTTAFRKSFFETPETPGKIATARGGNVIGGGDYAPDRIFPDVIRALSANRQVKVRNPNATRPWQHVLDCLSGYLTLGTWLESNQDSNPRSTPRAFNFGPTPDCERTVQDLVEEILKSWNGSWSNIANSNLHEASRLRIAIDLAESELNWRPVWGFSETVAQTVQWYRGDHDNFSTNDLKELMVSQIKAFSDSNNQQ
ncbi:MAG: CDP-glucose 4,6-dehydratase [Verrucomicrobiales bacterium]|nr:CDP-glucose 4,6-dehydratase [Verrucomicrobiales bacterium]